MKITDIKAGNVLEKKSDTTCELFLVTKVCKDFIWVINNKGFIFNKIYEKPSKYLASSLDDYELFADYSGDWKERVL